MPGEDGGHSIIKHNNYRYRVKSTSNRGVKYLQCTGYEGNECSVTARLLHDGSINVNADHFHPPQTHQIATDAFINTIKQQIKRTPDIASSEIYRRCAEEHADIARYVPFVSLERSMARWRSQYRPRVPNTLLEYDNLLNDERWKEFTYYRGGKLTAQTIQVDEETSVTVFGDIDFLATLQDVSEWYIDATFDICPVKPNVEQFLTIMGRVDGCTIPLSWAMMTKKTTQAYFAVFHHFNEMLAPHIVPNIVHQDFEVAIKNAILQVYPNVTIVHCLFHHMQAISRRLKSKGKLFMRQFMKWDLAQVFVRKIMGLALLPANDIQNGYDWLKTNTASDIKDFLEDAIAYYENYWLTRVRPENFSVYGCKNRTNNPLESYHRLLNEYFGQTPRIWDFTVKLRDLQSKTRRETETINMGISIRRPIQQKYLIRSETLSHAWHLYNNGVLTIPRFLSFANHWVRSFKNPLIVHSVNDVDYFIDGPVHDIHIQRERQQVGALVIEGEFHDGIWIPPMIMRHGADEEISILIYADLDSSQCPYCRSSILNFVCLPCQHWFACYKCTKRCIEHAKLNREQLICETCSSPCAAFRMAQIS